MKKKTSAKDNLNLLLSAFLILAYIVCGYFFMNIANNQTGLLKPAITALVLVVFGLIVFYATRVGEGKIVTRFSVLTLIVLDIPALYIVLASILPQLPLYQFVSMNSVVSFMAAVALGYGIPYTFISGFETVAENKEEVAEEVVEGGIQQEILETQQEIEQEEQDTEEIVVEGASVAEELDDNVQTEDSSEEQE